MKKRIILVMFLGAFNFSQAQKVSTKLAKGKIEDWYISQDITNGTDTMTYFYMSYQNFKYSHIVDIGSILFSQKADLQKFADELVNLANSSDSVSITTKVGMATLATYDFTKAIQIADRTGKYTYITREDAIKLADEINLNVNLLK